MIDNYEISTSDPMTFDGWLANIKASPNQEFAVTMMADELACRAERIRPTIEWEIMMNRLMRALAEPNVKGYIIISFSLLNAHTMYEVMNHFHGMFKKYNKDHPDMFIRNPNPAFGLHVSFMPVKYAYLYDEVIEFCEKYGLTFKDDVVDAKHRVGTAVGSNSSILLHSMWQRVKLQRQGANMDHYFPLMNQMITELKDFNSPQVRKTQ